ncbi:MAG TPA: ATP-grasp domain-containing protein [Nitrolancea sp.]|jgi:biotin carboxylase|nr:ATP-grasp domain-containing protein [Nitrolancea sp.]
MTATSSTRRKRVILLVTPTSYRSGAFNSAAEKLNIDVIHGIDLPKTLSREWDVQLGLDFSQPQAAAEQIENFVRANPVDAIISVDDSASILAALANDRLGLPGNAPDAAVAARDKHVMRRLLAEHGVPVPGFLAFSSDENEHELSLRISYPCVVKPTQLSGSRGVIRADNPSEFVAAVQRTRGVIQDEGGSTESGTILVEDFIPGFEVALEGLLDDGELQVLALFDKPDPLDGPFFEETIYVTPSRLPQSVQEAIAECTKRAARALGLREGPVHAELRVNESGPWILEIAGRSIGGLCSTILEFGTGLALEELILLQAIGSTVSGIERDSGAVGVMMIPIPKGGILRGFSGVEEAESVAGITGIEITARLNHSIVPLPEGSSYLGFIFARGSTPDAVEESLRTAHEQLQFQITPELRLRAVNLAR